MDQKIFQLLILFLLGHQKLKIANGLSKVVEH